MTPTALIDGDIVAYHCSARCERDGGWDDSSGPTYDEDDVRTDIQRMLDEWTDKAGAGGRVILLTGTGNFRKIVEPTYKSNRIDKPKPLALQFARSLLLEQHGAKTVDGLEADDLIGLMLTGTMADGRGVAVSLDKDLKTVPGLHFNPRKDRKPIFVTAPAADLLWMTQTLTGDPVDGYAGAKGIGPAKAKKALDGRRTVEGMWSSVVATFQSVGMSLADAIRNARLARILRTGDYDKTTKEVRLWHPTSPERLALPSASPS